MAQFGWSALIKTALFTAVATSGVWLVAGMAYYEREWQRPGTVAAADGGPVSTADYLPKAAGTAPAAAAEPSAPASMITAPVLASAGQPLVLQSPAPGTLQIPVTGVKASALIDTFTDSRADGRVHDAIDIPAPRGTPVLAAAAGTVERLFTSKLGGTTVYLRSTDRRVVYYYAHLEAYAPGLAEGQVLAAGAPIGFVGSSGNADPAVPHLHFAVLTTAPEAKWYDPATAVNPFPLFVRPR